MMAATRALTISEKLLSNLINFCLEIDRYLGIDPENPYDKSLKMTTKQREHRLAYEELQEKLDVFHKKRLESRIVKPFGTNLREEIRVDCGTLFAYRENPKRMQYDEYIADKIEQYAAELKEDIDLFLTLDDLGDKVHMLGKQIVEQLAELDGAAKSYRMGS